MRLLALVEARDHVCFRYRIEAFEPALRKAGVSLHQEPIEARTLGRLAQLRNARHFDAVILQRKLLPGWQLSLLRANARRLIFDYDDAILFRDSYSPKGQNSSWRARRFGRIVTSADAVLAGNRFLADCALARGAKTDRVQILPTCIDLKRYPDPRSMRPKVALGPELVWIGSSSTLNGLERERSLWERLGAEIPGLRMKVICDRFPRFQGVSVIEVPWSQEGEARELATSGIGIGLLPDDPWSRGKCGLKILQYQAAGLPVIANPLGAHKEMIQPDLNGFLASSPEEWISAIRTLAHDEGTRRRMGDAGRLQLETSYSTKAWADAFVDAVTGRRASQGSSPHVLRGASRIGIGATSAK